MDFVKQGESMGNSCSDESVADTQFGACRNEHCSNALIFTAEETYPECQSIKPLNQKDQTDSATGNNGLIQPLSAMNGLKNSGFPFRYHFRDIDSGSVQMQKPSIIGLLNQKAASSPSALSTDTAILRTHAERGGSEQGDGGEFSKQAAELRLYIVTWNMNGRLHEAQKNLSLLLDLEGEKHDLYVIGLQEAPNFSAEVTFGKLLGDMYCCVGMSSMMSLQLYIYARKSLRSYITGTRVDKVGVGGLGYVIGRQKGAAAVLLGYNNLSLLFITSHLAPHKGNVLERNHQFERICQSVFTKSHGPCPSCKDLELIMSVKPEHKERHVHNFVEESDVVIWLGDLNYRVEMPRSSVGFLISHNLEEILWPKDQLHIAVERGEVFRGFSEGPLLFHPTYKFEVGTDNYSKERTPSWTDRILYKVKSACAVEADLTQYNSITVVKTSDHKPVKAHLTLKNLGNISGCP